MNRYLWVVTVGAWAAWQTASHVAAQEVDYSQLKLAHALEGHEESISAMVASPDSRTLATASYDKTLRIWDLPAGEVKRVHQGHGDTVRALVFSPDGAILASAGRDKTIKLWNVATGEEIATLPCASEARALTFSPDGATLASASHDKTITLWDVRSGEQKTTILTGHRARVREMIYSRDGMILASNGYYDLKIWDMAGKEIGAVPGRVTTMRFSPDGDTLASAIGHRVTHWTVSGGQDATIVEGNEYAPYKDYPAILSPDGNTLASIDKDLMGVDLGRGLVPFGKQRCRLILMDVKSGEERTILEERGEENWFGPMWYSPSGSALALWNGKDESIALVDAATGREQAKLTSPDGEKFRPGRIPPLVFTSDGRSLVTTHGLSIAVWKLP